MGALPKEKEGRRFTYADYKGWELDEGERFELINGEAFAMSGPNTRHQAILMALSSQIYVYLRDKPCKVFPAPYDVRLFYEEDESDDTVVQPDIVVICDEKKIGPEGCRGAPDMVIEILSPSNAAIEMERKFKLYRRAGVREYWIVDGENNGLTVYHFQDGAIHTNTYGNPRRENEDSPEASETVSVTIFPELHVNLEQVFRE